MTPYSNLGGNSNITAFEYGPDWIRVRFGDGSTYQYDASRIGVTHFERMKKLAESGSGLNAYINLNRTVRNGWSSRR